MKKRSESSAESRESKTCPQCGATVDGNAKFCYECGYSFAAPQQPPESGQKRPTFFGWLKKHLMIVAPVALGLVVVIVMLALIPTFVLSSVNGTYYLCREDGKIDEDGYIKLSTGKWKNSDGLSGTYTVSGKSVTLTYRDKVLEEVLGDHAKFTQTGTIENHVLTFENVPSIDGGRTVTYRTKSHKHKLGETTILTEPTCTEEGVEGKVCACGYAESGTIPEAGHVWDNKNVCTVCGTSDRLDFTLTDDGSSYILTKAVIKTANPVVIPAKYKGKPVTEIGKSAFSLCGYLTAVTIPDSVTSIESSAFYSCKKLKSITVPNGVTSIGDYAFKACTALESVTLPDSVTSIGNEAFEECTSIGSIILPGGATSIGNNAFLQCTRLKVLTIPNSVTSIGSSAFSGCKSLETITVESGNPNYHSADNCLIETATKTLILGCNNSVIPSDGSVTKIGERAFSNYYLLTDITIPDSVTSIGAYAFYNCDALTAIAIPDSVTSIGEAAFCDCSTLASVTIGSGVTSIGNQAFRNCDALTAIVIPDSVTDIGKNAFWSCALLTSVTIGSGMTRIENGTFNDCPSLASIIIPDGVTDIGEEAFSDCKSLTEITIPDSMTGIGKNAFYGCTKLTSITIPNSVTSIGERLFFFCTNLTNITFEGTKAEWNALAKGSLWDHETGNYTVHCTDGDIVKE